MFLLWGLRHQHTHCTQERAHPGPAFWLLGQRISLLINEEIISSYGIWRWTYHHHLIIPSHFISGLSTSRLILRFKHAVEFTTKSSISWLPIPSSVPPAPLKWLISQRGSFGPRLCSRILTNLWFIVPSSNNVMLVLISSLIHIFDEIES